jgi:hypothetical protein
MSIGSIRAQIPPIHPGGLSVHRRLCAGEPDPVLDLWTPLGWIGTVLTVWCALFLSRSAAGDAGARRHRGGAGRRARQR